MAPNERDPRVGLESKLELFEAFAELPDKMPQLVDLYRTGAANESTDDTVRRIAALFDCSTEVAIAIDNLQFRYLHPRKQSDIREEIEILREQLKSL